MKIFWTIFWAFGMADVIFFSDRLFLDRKKGMVNKNEHQKIVFFF